MAINVFVKSGGTTLEEVTATKDKVLSEYTYNDSEGEVQTGTMPNNGAINKVIDVGEEFNSNAGYYSSINITGPILSGTATTRQVLSGYSFYNTTGTKETGSMIHRGRVTCNLDYEETYSGGNGYYSIVKVTAPSRYGDASASHVLEGKTFMNSTTNSTGTMVNRGDLIETIDNFGDPNSGDTSRFSTTNAGYYSSITVNCTWTVYTKTQEINGHFCNTGVTATGYYGISTTYSSANSIKIFTSAGYVWMTRNAGTGSATARIVKIWS